MGADKGKKQKVGELEEENNVAEKIDGELVLSIEKLQEIQDELEKVILFFSFLNLNFGFLFSFHFTSVKKIEDLSGKLLFSNIERIFKEQKLVLFVFSHIWLGHILIFVWLL